MEFFSVMVIIVIGLIIIEYSGFIIYNELSE